MQYQTFPQFVVTLCYVVVHFPLAATSAKLAAQQRQMHFPLLALCNSFLLLSLASGFQSSIYKWILSSTPPDEYSTVDSDKQFQIHCTVLRTTFQTTSALSVGGCFVRKLSPSGDWLKVPTTPELSESLGINESLPLIVESHFNGSTDCVWHLGESARSLNTYV